MSSKRILHVLELANSKNINGKRSALQELSQIYENKGILLEITRNSVNFEPHTVSWNDILHGVHNIVMAHGERSTAASKKKSTELFLQTIILSNSTLQTADLISFVLQVLNCRTSYFCHTTYISALHNHILPVVKYRNNISREQWTELLKVCVNCYQDEDSPVKKDKVLDAIQLIVKYGCSLSQLTFRSRKLIPFLVQVFKDMESNEAIIPPGLKLAIVICQEVAFDSRKLLCEFGETIIPKCMNFPKLDEKYELFLRLVQAHHPIGARIGDELAYVTDVTAWKTILCNMCSMILQTSKTQALSESCIDLGCEVFRHLSEDPSVLEEIFSQIDSQSTENIKRRRTSNDNGTFVNLIPGCHPERALPMLKIFTKLFKKYPTTLKAKDITLFLQTVSQLLMKSSSLPKIVETLYELGNTLVNVEQHLDSQETVNNNKLLWSEILDTVTSYLSANHNEETGHRFLQYLIKNKKVMNLNSLLKMYVSKTMNWSLFSLQTLLMVCNCTTLPETLIELSTNFNSEKGIMSPLETQLLEWVSNISWKKILTLDSVRIISELLIGLTLKSWNRTEGSKESNDLMINDLTFKLNDLTDIEKCYLATKFCINIFNETVNSCENQPKKDQLKHFLSNDHLNVLYSQLNIIFQVTDKHESVRIIIVKCALIARLAADLIEMNVLQSCNDFPLISLLQNNLQKIFKFLVDTDLTTLRHKDTLHLLKVLRILFQATTNQPINEILVSPTPVKVKALQNLYAFYQSQENSGTCIRSQDMPLNVDIDFICNDKLMEQANKDEEKQSIIKTLILYCCIATDDVLIDVQEQLLCSLLNSNGYDFKSHKDIELILNMLEIISNSNISIHTENSIKTVIDLLVEMFQYLYKNQTRAHKILLWMPKFLKLAMKFDHLVCHVMKIIGYFHNLLQEKDSGFKKSYGPSMHADFLKCLEQMIVIDSSLKFLKQNGSSNESVIEYLLKYINSPFYIVRLEAAQCVYKIFSLKEVDYEWKILFFEKLKVLLNDSFVINRNFEKYEEEGEKMTRGSSMLYTISAVIYGCNFLKLPGLFALINLAAQKGVEAKSVRKILQIATRGEENVIENNLYYLLISWYHLHQSFEKFPWDVTHCSTEDNFYNTYMNVLLPVLVQTGNLEQGILLCNEQELNFEREFERSFPIIIAWLLFKVSKNPDAVSQNIFRNLESNQKEFKSIRRFIDLVHENLDQIIISLIRELHDEDYFSKLSGLSVKFPETKFMHLLTSDIDECLSFMEKHFFSSGKFMHYLAVERHDVLQKVLLKLTRDIYDSSDEYKLKAFHQYIYFCNAIAKEIKNFQFDEISPFLIRDICCTLLHQIDQDSQITEVTCKYLYSFLQTCLPQKCGVFKEIFIPCVKSLTRCVTKNEKSSAFGSLEFLLVTQKKFFTDVIPNLDFFPNTPAFEEMRKVHNSLRFNSNGAHSLETEIVHFLNVSSDKNFSGTESLVRLRNQLSLRRKELKQHYEKLEMLRGFAEDSASSKIHRLIHKLTKLLESSDPVVSQEAAKCLGYLGPGNLATMILLPENTNRIVSPDRLETLTYKILVLLSDLINDKDIDIREASANALYSVLSLSWSQNLVNQSYLKNFEGAMNSRESKLSLDYIRPFLTKSEVRNPTDVHFKICSGLKDDSWIENAGDVYSNWVKKFSCIIANCFQNFYMKCIIPIFNLSTQFCEKLLPWMVYVMFDDSKLSRETCTIISRFFYHHFSLLSDESHLSTKSDKRKSSCTYESVHCMLNIVNFIWIQSERVVPLNLDYLFIAKGAQFCSAYFTSVLYAELWCDSFLNGNRDIGSGTIIDYIIEKDPIRGKILQDIIREANVKIGDPDAIHGCGSMYLLDSASRIRHYVDLKQWDKAMLMQDIELSCGIDSTKDMLDILQQTGLYFLLNQFSSNVTEDKISKHNNDYKYECAWRLGDWGLLETKQCPHSSQISINSLNEEKHQSYQQHHYEALKCLNENDTLGVKQAIDSARSCVIKYLRNTSLESTKAVYPMLSQLQMLREIEEWTDTNSSDYGDRIGDWEHYEYIKNNEFEYVEPIISQRVAICKIMQSRVMEDTLKNVLIDLNLNLVQYAEERGHFRIATRTLDSLAKQDNLSQEIKNKLCYIEAHLAWSQDNQRIAQFLLRLLMNNDSASPSLRAQALCMFGNWIGKTESGNPQVIIKQYYQESINTSLGINKPLSQDLENLFATQAALARFSDMQYRQISEYIKSPQFKTLKSLTVLSNTMSTNFDSKDIDLRRAISIYQRQSKNDASELESFEKDKNTYLLLALEYYLKTLEQSKGHDFLIFRVVSLWLDNMHHSNFNTILAKYLPKIASYKFVPLIPQLAPHMNLINDQFSSKINEILRKCATEHPHHTLPVLLALKNLTTDFEFSKCQPPQENNPTARVKAATKLINQLLKTKIHPIIEEMTQLSYSLVMLAYMEIPKIRPNETHTIPTNQAISSIKNLNNIVIPTLNLSVRKNGNYDNIIGIQKYKNTFVTVGGINAPKRVECIGTDGIARKQLVKGQDDMRQDAVMQQVFTVINSLLSANKETKERKLNIRTYKVVPLTQRSGVLEWCENTMPLSTILLGADRNSGIHKKYYPQDYTGMECRKKMNAVSSDSNEIKLKTYLECCKNLHPAFHHFFIEQYPSSEVWFERRLTYTRSIATNSIVGYILSVGDRHLQNILIDHTTAEVIHIDFGIAFEQGKLLSTPETVPFRLTRDIEVPMGVSGVEGVMRRCCEQTLKLLQEQREIIVTLLQVLLYDPLFIWSISSTKAYKRQTNSTSGSSISNDDSLEINKFANRALLKVQQKLQGVEEGVTLSVEGQVERLIQQARDPSNLCLLFHGWQAYL